MKSKLLVVMKTDISKYTETTNRTTAAELEEILNANKEIIIKLINEYEGRIIKGEGDSFWITFESINRAIECAFEIIETSNQKEIKKNTKNQLKLKIALNMGEVYLKDNDIFGETVNLTARMESITEPGRIYVSRYVAEQLKESEYRILKVDDYKFKGFDRLIDVYSIMKKTQTKIFENHYLLASDIRSFGEIISKYSVERIEEIIDKNEELNKRTAVKYNGEILLIFGDTIVIMFDNLGNALKAGKEIINAYNTEIYTKYKLDKSYQTVVISKGDLRIYKNLLYGEALNGSGVIDNYVKKINKKSYLYYECDEKDCDIKIEMDEGRNIYIKNVGL